MTAGSVHTLVRRYGVVLATIGIPLLLLVAGLAVARFHYESAIQFETFGRDADDLQRAVEAYIAPAVDHVRQLRQAAEDQLSGRLAIPPSPLRALLAEDEYGDLSLREIARTPREEASGALYGHSDMMAARDGDLGEIDIALGLFGPMRLGQLTAWQLRASYYISGRGDFFVGFPASTARDLGPVSGRQLVNTYPGVAGSWTAVALDKQGDSRTVDYAAEVRTADVVVGIVATTVLLEPLNRLLVGHHGLRIRAWVVDDNDVVLAESVGASPSGEAMPVLAGLRPPAVATNSAVGVIDIETTPYLISGWAVVARPLAGAPWHLIVAVNEREITSLVLRRLWPVGVLLSGLLVAIVLAQILMHCCFVGPAIALANRVQELGDTDGEPSPTPRMPMLWRPWFTAVDATFRSGRLALARAREEQALKSAVVEAAFDAVITTDDSGLVVEFSPSAETMFGYRRAETLGRPIAELIVPQHLRAAHEHGLRRYRATGERHVLGRCIETEGMRASGAVFPVELAVAEVLLKDRRLFTATLRDITDAKQVEARLRTSVEEFGMIADGIPIAITIARRGALEVLFSNSHAQDLFGLYPGCPPEQIIAVYVDPVDRIRLRDRVAETGSVEGWEVEARRRDGSTMRVLVAARIIRFRGTDAVLTASTDISSRLRTEQALRASEMRLAAFMQHAPVGMYLKALDGRYIMLNPEMAKVFDRPVADVVGRSPEEVFGPAEATMIRTNDHETLAHGRATVKEEFLPGLDQYSWSMVIRFPIRDETGEIVHIAGFNVDITNQKRAEAELHRQSEMMYQREKLAALGSLLAGVAHELNNPLSVMLGRAIMLEEEIDDAGIRNSLGRLRAAAERCARIVRSFLALARQKPREPKVVDVRTVLDAGLEILASGLRSAGVVTFRRDPPDLPAVLADGDELHQVFLNLIVNAQQAMESGEPSNRRLWIDTAAGGDDVRVEVADNGPGVPSVLREKIFDPFFTTKSVGEGTGLGLSVCHRIVSDHGGTIRVDERPGGGARFTVTLPAWRAEPEPAMAVLASAEGTGGDVLVVDDEAEVVAMLEEALARDGHRVMTAPDGVAALELLRAGDFDAILCDIRMPGLDGPGLARALAATRPGLMSRLLLMTGDVLRAAEALPANLRGGLLEKPLDPGEVRSRVLALVAAGASAAPSADGRPRVLPGRLNPD